MVRGIGDCNKCNLFAEVRYAVEGGEVEEVSCDVGAHCIVFVGRLTLAYLSTYENHSVFLLHNFVQSATCLIMIYNGKKEATTGLEKPHRQNRDLSYI